MGREEYSALVANLFRGVAKTFGDRFYAVYAMDGDINTLKNDRDPRHRLAAIEGLSKSDDSRAIEAIIQATGDENQEVATKAQTALANKGEIVIDPLIQATNSYNPKIVNAVKLVLLGMNHPVVLRHLEEARLSSKGSIDQIDTLIATLRADARKEGLTGLLW